MVKLTSSAPINIECTRSINDEQKKFVENHRERVKAFAKNYGVYITVSKNEINALTLLIGKRQQKDVDPKEVAEAIEKTMDKLVDWINDSIIEAIKAKESTGKDCEQTQEESTENEFFFIRKTSTGYEATGNMDPRKVLPALKAAAIFKMIEENEKPE